MAYESWIVPAQALSLHFSHGPNHGSLAVAMGLGVDVDPERLRARTERGTMLLHLDRTLVKGIATYLSNAAGPTLPIIHADLPIFLLRPLQPRRISSRTS
jgi:hypothetical protein